MSTENSIDPNLISPDEDTPVQPNVHMLLKIVILGVIGVVSLVGNLIAFGTLFYRRRLLRQPMFIIIGGLALADIIITVMFVPENIINHPDKGHVTLDTWCKLYGFLYNSCQYISAFHIVVLAVLRGVLLTDRTHHGPRTVHAVITSLILWLTALLANIPVISLSIYYTFTKKCAISFGDDQEDFVPSSRESNSNELYTLLSAAFSFFLPLVLMFIIFILTGYMSKRYFEDSYSVRERRLSKMVTYLILSFTFCRLPFEMVNLLFHYQMKNADFVKLVTVDTYKYAVWIHVLQYLRILAMLDQAFRPIIYATMSREFGKMYDQIINCTICKNEDDVIPTRMQYRGQGIEEVLHTPLRRPIELDECTDPEPEEIM